MSLFTHTLGRQYQLLQMLEEEIFDRAGIFNNAKFGDCQRSGPCRKCEHTDRQTVIKTDRQMTNFIS